MPEQIVPPVSAAELARVQLPSVQQDLGMLQKLVAADKSVIAATIIHMSILLTAYFGLHLQAKQIAVIGSIVQLGIGLLLHMHFSSAKRP